MFVSKSSLFGAFAFLALSAIAEAHQVCKKYAIGNTDPPKFVIVAPDVPLPPSCPGIIYAFNSRPCPSGMRHVGTELEPCDEEIAPVVIFSGLCYATISRHSPDATGVVHGKIFCQANEVSSAAEPSPLASLGAGNLPHRKASVQH